MKDYKLTLNQLTKGKTMITRFTPLQIYMITYILCNYRFRFYAQNSFWATHIDHNVYSTIHFDGEKLTFLNTPF